MDINSCTTVEAGQAFKSVRFDHNLFKEILQKFALFPLEPDFIEYAKLNLQQFNMYHIRLLHKNFHQSEEIKKHVWIVSEQNQRDMRKEASVEWVVKYRECFNSYYNVHYWNYFVEADLSDVAHLIEKI
ncbi:MAG: hypothetical protein N3G21_01245 [Candidatus Hydrogenedentes bacterium]|nr:hypothetical protein [Candidatus Hydrogenedentota bacterium]